jgi:anhydro-N-acetylmuramic acid kinase
LGMRKWEESDLLALYTEITARSIALSYESFLTSVPDEVVLCGGGAKNIFLRQRIHAALPKVEVITSAERGWPVESIEAAAFAFLAWLRWQGLPGNLPETTGARTECLLGQVTDAE